MVVFRSVLLAAVLTLPYGIAAANKDDDGFIWIDANTRIKVRPASTTAGSGTTAPEKAPRKEDAKAEKKEKAKK